jgi:hypothetical protein
MPDVYSNVWSFNTPSGSDVFYVFGEEKSLIIESWITSVPITPENFETWHQFYADKDGDVKFYIVSGDNPDTIIMRDISPGASIQSVQSDSIRLQARFSRSSPASSPYLFKWNVSYVGRDEQPPVTTVQDIEGVQGLNDWYISESVILWLHSEDYPKDTGSGVKTIYYTLNDGMLQEYNTGSGLQLSVSQASHWTGEWEIVFWAEDNQGNEENRHKPENTRTVRIDAERPYVEITTPADEEQVEVPFWVRADPTDNVGVARVEFHIEPFGERDGLPYVDTEPPYEWYCDVENEDMFSYDGSSYPIGVNVMVRVQVFDEAGQSWIHEVWIYITNWENNDWLFNSCLFAVGISDGGFDSTNKPMGLVLPGWKYLEDISWDFSKGYCVAYDSGLLRQFQGEQQGTALSFIGLTTRHFIIGVADSISVQQ